MKRLEPHGTKSKPRKSPPPGASAKGVMRARAEAGAVEQQAATAHILRALSRSTTDPQPVFEAIVDKAHRLCGAVYTILYRYDGRDMDVVTARPMVAAAQRLARAVYPAPPKRDHIVGRAILDAQPVHTLDLPNDPRFPGNRSGKHLPLARMRPRRAVLAVPLMRDSSVIGAISVGRAEAKAFTKKEIELLETFADQAVIAIEKVRLFNETKEALEQQKASADILRIVAASVENADPVFNAITRAGQRLVPGSRVGLLIVRDGQLHHASHSGIPDAQLASLAKHFPAPLDRSTIAGASILDRQVIQVADIAEMADRYPRSLQAARASGDRSLLVVPLLHGAEAMGSLSIRRAEPGTFTDKQVDLARTFADQAVIAIRNARMFREIKERNAELKQSLDFQGASGAILASLSSSVTDTKPVFDAIAENTRRLLATNVVAVSLLRQDHLQLVAAAGDEAYLTQIRAVYPWQLEGDDGALASRAVRGAQVVHVCPIASDPDAPAKVKRLAKASGYDSILMVPMLRGGLAIGMIATARTRAIPFDDKQIALIKAFADQAVIAIENVRLFNETKEALEQQTATAQILQVIASSRSYLEPVMVAVVENAARLADADHALIGQAEGHSIRWLATHGCPLPAEPRPITRELPSGRAILDLQTTQVEDVSQIAGDARVQRAYRELGVRSIFATPLVRDGRAIGVLLLRRTEVRAFTDKQVALLKTFADQAVIAIENVRLFNETKEALERQTATSEVLRVISGTPADAQPVFEAIVQSTQRLMSGKSAALLLRRESEFYVAAYSAPGLHDMPAEVRTVPLDREKNFPSRVILDGEVLHIPDWGGDEVPEHEKVVAKAFGFGSGLQVPLLREGRGIGALVVTRQAKGAFLEKEIALLRSFADQAVIAIENARLFNETKEALEQQTGTSQVLSAISGSPTDVAPVYDTILENATRLCEASFAVVFLYDGEYLRAAAQRDASPAFAKHLEEGRLRPSRETTTRLAALERRVVQVEDLLNDPHFAPSEAHRAENARAVLSVPMLREGVLIGVITVWRREPRRFSDKQVALLKTFADQAVIAIENVRLFNETKEALEQQTAISEVLRVISDSPTDVKPVLEAVAVRAARICEASDARIWLVEGQSVRHVAGFGDVPMPIDLGEALPLDRGTVSGRAILDRAPVHVEDMAKLTREDYPISREMQERSGFRTILSVPLMREQRSLGAIMLRRLEVRSFTDKQIALLKTFADQAAIAIENVRLFNETNEALEQQTAISEVLRVISDSPTDVKPVLDAVALRAARICDATDARIFLVEGEHFRHAAGFGDVPITTDIVPLNRGSPSGRAIIDRAALHVEDMAAALEEDFPVGRPLAMRAGWRTVLSVPLMREDRALGAITLRRMEVRPFTEKQIGLLKTFADQAAIAIENVRLFNETKEALEQQTATAEILRVISSSPTDIQPVLDAVAESAARLCEAVDAVVALKRGDEFGFAAHHGPIPISGTRALSRETVAGRVMLEGRQIHVHDLQAETREFPQGAEYARHFAYRTMLATPLMREGMAIGAILVRRTEMRPFGETHLALVKTFADQAVIAIENVRLFNELQTRNRALTEALEQQTATGEILKTISSSTTDVQPVFETIIRNAVRLCDGAYGMLFRYDGKLIDIDADCNFSPEARAEFRRAFPQPPTPGNPTAQAILERRAVNMPDVFASAYSDAVMARARALGYRSGLAVPMMRGDQPIGAIAVTRREPGAFSESYVDLLKTFAAQAVIAIENVRLFNEINEALRLQTSTAEVLKTISRSTFDLDRVLQALLDNAARLSGAERATMLRPDAEGNFVPTVTFNYPADSPLIMRMREQPIRPGRDSINGRVLLEKRPIHVPDVLADAEYGRQDLVGVGRYRTVFSVPMLRDGEAIGLIALTKGAEVDPFSDKQMELVTTFADQAVIAIENVRLFKEIEEKSAQLEVANKHKSDFLANMSHELRTPLNAIIGFSEALMERMFGELTEKQADYLKDIHESGRHLLSLINDILDLSKIEAGRMELELSSFHLPTALSNAMTLIRERAQRHAIELGLEVDERLAEFSADERKFKQIMLNLLSNAVKFTPDGGRVDVCARKDTEKVEIAVKDTGIGIAPEDQAAVFEEFKQVGRDNLRKAEGTGLGLALTKRFVELHGGAIRLESMPGKGSTFTVSLPMRG